MRFGTIKLYRRALALRAAGIYITSRVRCAARYAALTGVTIHDAAKVFDVNAGGVWNAWERMFPTTPHPKRLGL